jgi:hypothetical protein
MRNAITKASLVTLPLLLALVALVFANPSGDFWGSVESPKAQVESYDATKLAVATSLDSSIYDWTKLNRVIREPQNTVSNLAYVFVGLAVCFAASRRVSKSFGVACVFLGVGSALYHASLLPEWRMLDILGVYAVLFSLIGVGFAAVTQRSANGGIFVTSAWLIAFYTGIHRNDVRVFGFKAFDSTYVVVASVAVVALLAARRGWQTQDKRRYFRVIVVVAAAAIIAFIGGATDRFGGLWGRPGAVIQGHACWHTFGAMALLAAYEIFAMNGFDGSVLTRRSSTLVQPAPMADAFRKDELHQRSGA